MHWRVEQAVALARWKLRYAKRRLVLRFLPQYAHRTKVKRWEHVWGADDFAPGWTRGPIPAELQEAANEGWFPKGGRVLDIGCGDGRLARWLAEQGYEVLGVDFASGAVARARDRYGAMERLTFVTLDVCTDDLGAERFDALLDRGTLHTVEASFRRAYAANVARAAKPGAAFLLLHVTSMRHEGYRDQEPKKEKVARRVTKLFRESFEVERITDAGFGDEQDGQPFARGLAFWLRRR